MRLEIPEDLTRRAYRAIRDEILKGKLNNRKRLTEAFFASRFGISKSPIREAFNRLEADGLISIRPRRGAFVVDFSVQDVNEIYELRELLETTAVRHVVFERKSLAKLRAALNSAKEALRKQDKVSYILADFEFHRVIAQANTNSRLRKVLESMHGQMLVLRHRTFELFSNRAVVDHERILEALEKGKNEAAATLMAEHIRSVRAKLLEYLSHQADGKSAPRPPRNSRNR